MEIARLGCGVQYGLRTQTENPPTRRRPNGQLFSDCVRLLADLYLMRISMLNGLRSLGERFDTDGWMRALFRELLRALFLAVFGFLAVSGIAVAHGSGLAFPYYAILQAHRHVGFFLFVSSLIVYFPVLGRPYFSLAAAIGLGVLCVVLPALPLVDMVLPFFIPYQVLYVVAGLLTLGYLVWCCAAAPPPSRRRGSQRLIVILTLWLFVMSVMLTGIHLYTVDSLRSNFYHLFHRYVGTLTAALMVWQLIAQQREEPRGHHRELVAGAVAVVVLLGVAAAVEGHVLARRFESQRLPTPETPVRINMEETAAGKDLRPPRLVLSSHRCESCHAIIHQQWNQSLHRLAGRTESYQRLVTQVRRERGDQMAMMCSRCHTPLLAMAGRVDDPTDRTQDELRNEGVSCQYCHIVDAVRTPPANGYLTIQFNRDFFQDYDLDDYQINDFRSRAMLANLMVHRNLYRRTPLVTSEYCGACHRTEMPFSLASGQPLILGDTYTPFANSKPHAEGLNCQACHMPLSKYAADVSGEMTEIHAHPDHRFLGTAQALSLLVPDEAQTGAVYGAAVRRFLAGEAEMPGAEYYYLWMVRDPKLPAVVNYLNGHRAVIIEITAAAAPAPGRTFRFVVTTRNNTAAHVLPSGPLDMNEMWLEVTASDADGRELLRSPGLGQDHYLGVGAVKLGAELTDATGQAILEHRFWAIAAIKSKQVLLPDQSRNDEFVAEVPSDAHLPIKIAAAWNYRRYNQHTTEYFFGRGITMPVTTLNSASHVFQ
jgi:hypothetical protein